MTKFLFYASGLILSALVLFAIVFAISSFIDGKVFTGIGCIVGAAIAGYADYLLLVGNRRIKE